MGRDSGDLLTPQLDARSSAAYCLSDPFGAPEHPKRE